MKRARIRVARELIEKELFKNHVGIIAVEQEDAHYFIFTIEGGEIPDNPAGDIMVEAVITYNFEFRPYSE